MGQPCIRTMHIVSATILTATIPAATAQVLQVTNAGFEERDPATGFARGWVGGVGPGTEGSAVLDDELAHSGSASVRITNATPHEAYKYVLVNSDWAAVQPEQTYVLRFWVRGEGVSACYAGAGLEGAGQHRQALPAGDYDWRPESVRLTTPPDCQRISIRFISDGITGGLWIDDVSLEVSDVQLANITEARPPRPYSSWFPRTPGPVPEHLTVVDISGESRDVRAPLVALQGLVNRNGARLYLINVTNPPGHDGMWLEYMREKGYTGAEGRIADPMDAIARFRDHVKGVIVWDPELPGTQNAAWMLAGLKDALPVPPEMAAKLELPVIEDLRGRWVRNVDAYRHVYETHWPDMSQHLLAWEHPDGPLSSRDTMVQHKVFMLWLSAHGDGEKGADPAAEMEFVEEILGQTPGNVPVMGWPMHAQRGISEYTFVRLLSEYGKWVPGTGYSSNVSVHSAIEPPARVFRQRPPIRPPRKTPRPDRVYLSVNVLDSGDSHWYWQFHQRKIWDDPARGSTPTGYCMNPTLLDVMPLVAQWYYENMTPNDALFGFQYTNAPVYASRFRSEDRERIWREFVAWQDGYRRRLDMDGIEVFGGGTGGPPCADELLGRFTAGMPGLRYILAGLGRHAGVTPDRAARMVDDVPVFDTLTNFRIWTDPAEALTRTMDVENAYLIGEIKANTPATRPAYMGAMAISWYYYPTWMKALQEALPAEYEMVSPGELAGLYQSRGQ